MHWHIAVDHGYGNIEVRKEPVYWVMNDAWAEMTKCNNRIHQWGGWTMVECKDLECVLREMT